MESKFTLSIAGLSLGFHWAEASSFSNQLREHYGPFVVDNDPDIAFEVSPRPFNGETPSDAALREEDSQIVMERSDFRGVYDLTGMGGQLETAENPYSFDSFLRVFASWLLPSLGGLVVHAASMVHDGRGYLFPGISGAGKSTITGLAGGAEPLTDELSLLRLDGDSFKIHGSPFWGELTRGSRPTQAPLTGLCFLRKDNEVRLAPLAKKDAVLGLLKTVMSFDKSQEGVDGLLQRIEHLAGAVKTQELFFSKTLPFWSVLDKSAKGPAVRA